MPASAQKGLDVDLPAETRPPNTPSPFTARHDKTLFIAGAGALRYREIVRVIDVAKGAGVDKVGIVTDGRRK